jgi:hypothetical protein
MLQRNMMKCNCHRLNYLVLYYKQVITLILSYNIFQYLNLTIKTTSQRSPLGQSKNKRVKQVTAYL